MTAEAWNACANPAGRDQGNGAAPLAPALAQATTLENDYNPFISHEFLCRARAVAVGPAPRRLAAAASLRRSTDGTLVGAVPCYVKSHSQGEYVFDHGWAEAYERAGGSYYPKLQVSVPFTPATGRRLLVRPGPHADAMRGALADALIEYLPALRCLLGPRHLSHPSRNGSCWGGAASSSAPTSSSIGRMPATTRSTRSWRRSPRASARPSAASARTRCANGISVHWLTGVRSHRERVGRVLRVLHGDRLAQMGTPLSHALVLFARRREDARPHPPGDGQAQRPLDRRRHQFHRLDTLFGRHWGASSITRSCTSSSATTRPSNMPSSTSSLASRPAPRASTRSRAATCRPRPIRRTTSPIPGCAARSTIFSSTSAPMWRRPATSLRRQRRSARSEADYRRDGALYDVDAVAVLPPR